MRGQCPALCNPPPRPVELPLGCGLERLERRRAGGPRTLPRPGIEVLLEILHRESALLTHSPYLQLVPTSLSHLAQPHSRLNGHAPVFLLVTRGAPRLPRYQDPIRLSALPVSLLSSPWPCAACDVSPLRTGTSRSQR
ncbi:hypothetical protein H8959_019932 [Pygathrix nigripes]